VVIGTTVTWDPANKTSRINLDGTKLIATYNDGGITFGSVKATTSVSSGDHSFSVVINQNDDTLNLVGIGNATADVNNYVGFDHNSVGLLSNGQIWTGGGSSGATVGGYANGDTVTAYLKASSSLLFFKTNSGDWNNNPSANTATGVGGFDIAAASVAAGPYFPMVSMYILGNQLTANFGGW
jgi:hypothetical protein